MHFNLDTVTDNLIAGKSFHTRSHPSESELQLVSNREFREELCAAALAEQR